MTQKNLKVTFGEYWEVPGIQAFKKFKPTINDDGTMSLVLTNKNSAKIINELAYQIVKKSYEIYFGKFLKDKFNEHDIKLIIKNHLNSQENAMYFNALVRIILGCFLIQNDKINLTAFINFNIDGMKCELFNIAELEIASGGHYVTAAEGFQGLEFVEADPDINIPEIIEKIDDKYLKNKPEIDDKHKAVLMYINSNEFVLCDNDLEVITHQYFENIAEQPLGLREYIDNFNEDDATKNLIEVSLFFMIYLEVFNPPSAILFGNIDDEIKDIFRENVNAHNENLNNPENKTNFYTSSSLFPRRVN